MREDEMITFNLNLKSATPGVRAAGVSFSAPFLAAVPEVWFPVGQPLEPLGVGIVPFLMHDHAPLETRHYADVVDVSFLRYFADQVPPGRQAGANRILVPRSTPDIQSLFIIVPFTNQWR
jgi:hypothetical protein